MKDKKIRKLRRQKKKNQLLQREECPRKKHWNECIKQINVFYFKEIFFVI